MFRRRLLTALVAVGVALLFVTGPAMAAPGDGVSTDGADLINDGDQGANDDALRGGLVDDFDDGVSTDGADLINDGDQGGISAGSGD
jgi:hypothetical protein